MRGVLFAGTYILVFVATGWIAKWIFLDQPAQQRPIVHLILACQDMPMDAIEEDINQRAVAWSRQAADVEAVTTITTADRTDIYFTGRLGTDAEKLLASIHEFASGDAYNSPTSRNRPVSFLANLLAEGESIPKAEIYEEPVLDVSVDEVRLAQLGIDHAAFQEALAEAIRTSNTLQAGLTITVGQQTVKLEDVATLVVKYQPSHIVNRYTK